MLEQPLGLPQGSVRAIISIGIVGIAGYQFISGKIDSQSFLTLMAVVTGYYFVAKK